MSHNKGKRFIFCKECNKRRYCEVSYPGNRLKRWTCSKGHSWTFKIPTTEEITNIMKECFTKDKLENLFNRDNTFYSQLKNR